ncbi:hypothetical protein DRN67_04485, partial [Candidatus Micrarchaeota archaeon]
MRKAVALVLALSMLLPVALYVWIGGGWSYDIGLWYESGRIAHEQGILNVYRIESATPGVFAGGYFAFPLPWLIICELTYKLVDAFSLEQIAFAYLIRLLPFLAFEATTILLFIYTREMKGEVEAATVAFIYAVGLAIVNWITLVTLGQMDTIPVFFTVLGLLLASRDKIEYAMLSLGIGAAFKLYPLVIALALLIYAFRGRRRGLMRCAVWAIAPLLLVSIPPLIHDAQAYIGAFTFYSGWVGSVTLYFWVYSLLGLNAYLWYGSAMPAGAPLQYIPIITAISLLFTCIALLLAYIKTGSRKMQLDISMGLPVIAVLA